jgi:hypothetical protein
MTKTLTITVTIPDPSNLHEDGATTEGTWTVSDSFYQHHVYDVAAQVASEATDYHVHTDELSVSMFQTDGRSLEGTDGITRGSLLIVRK